MKKFLRISLDKLYQYLKTSYDFIFDIKASQLVTIINLSKRGYSVCLDR